MREFFDKRGYPASVVQVGHHRAQLFIGSQHYIRHRRKIHPRNHAVKFIILNDFKLLQNNLGTGRIFWSDLPLISFKRDKNTSNFLSEVHSKQVINPELLNAKYILAFVTLRKYWDLSDPSRSLIISSLPKTMSS